MTWDHLPLTLMGKATALSAVVTGSLALFAQVDIVKLANTAQGVVTIAGAIGLAALFGYSKAKATIRAERVKDDELQAGTLSGRNANLTSQLGEAQADIGCLNAEVTRLTDQGRQWAELAAELRRQLVGCQAEAQSLRRTQGLPTPTDMDLPKIPSPSSSQMIPTPKGV